MKENHLIIFVHIPKTAGTTFHRIVERQYFPNCIFTIDGENISQSIETLKIKIERNNIDLKMLRGHMPFGLHRLFSQQISYLTILRNPIERIISHYYYVVNTKNHYLHKYVRRNQISLKNYVTKRISTEIDNGQTRTLSGLLSGVVNHKDIDYGKCSSAMLNKAIKNLKKYFSIVGLTEKFDETLILTQKIYGWELPYYTIQKKTKFRPNINDISSGTLAAISEYNEYDIELYNYAKENFNNIMNQNFNSINEDVLKFKMQNTKTGKRYFYQTFYKSVIHKFTRCIRGY